VTNGGEKRMACDIAGKIVTFSKSEFLRIPLSFLGVKISSILSDTSCDMPAESETENREVRRFRNIIRGIKRHLLSSSLSEENFYVSHRDRFPNA